MIADFFPRTSWRTHAMPKISDIQETPNPNAVKFILREPVSNGVARQFASADQAQVDPLSKSLFDVGSVVSVFYMDNMITVEKEDVADWDELMPALAAPIRAAESASSPNGVSAVGGANSALTSADPRPPRPNKNLARKNPPAFVGECGYLRNLDLP